jgi:dipeptidase D
MSSEIAGLEPAAVWRNFYRLTRVPRPSGKEERVTAYIKEFAEKLGHDTYRDEAGNLVVWKRAAPGMENGKTVCLQSHVDMVCLKAKSVTHDCDKDPIDAFIDGEWVAARGTTLGADNGIGAAAAMAVLEEKNMPHGPLEVLFTVGEETGFAGAFGLKPGVLTAGILINLDSEHEGQLHVGSAGGRMTKAVFEYSEEETPPGGKAFEIHLTGMRGGHSGVDIHMGWGNAIKMFNRFLCHAGRSWEMNLASITIGTVISAIPGEGFAVVTVPRERVKAFRSGVREFEQTVRNELSAAEPDVKFEAVPTSLPARIIDKFTVDNMVRAICDCPNGVTRMSDEVDGLVDTSTNLGVLESRDGKISIHTFQRSFDHFSMQDVGIRIGRIFEWAGASEVVHRFLFPAWSPEPESKVLKEMQAVYEKLFNRKMKVKMVHAGLECGVFKTVYPDMDIVSMGPTIFFAHTPEEKVNIESVGDCWKFLAACLEHFGKTG